MINTLHGACFERRSWMTWTLSSHDEKRTVSRYSQDGPAEGVLAPVTSTGHERARAAYMLALALPGSACIYQGEELGLWEVMDIPRTNCKIPSTSAPASKNSGEMVVACRCRGRRKDPPLASVPVMKPGYLSRQVWADVSVATQLNDVSSTLHFFRSVLALRSTIFDDNEWAITWEPSPTGVLVLRRGPDFRCVVNFSGESWPIAR